MSHVLKSIREGVVPVVVGSGLNSFESQNYKKNIRTIAIHTPECEKPLEINYGLTYTCIECDECVFIYWKRVMVSRHGSTTIHYAKGTGARALMSM